MASRRRRESAAVPAPPRRAWLPVLILIAAGLPVYANSLRVPLVLDDQISVAENPQIRTLSSLAVLLPERELPIAGRPIVNLTLAINYALDGTNPRGYHAVNLLFHILCAVTLFGLVRRALSLATLRERFGDVADAAAFATTLLWLVHPLNSEVVNYITQRTESMMALGYLLTMYASIRALERPGDRLWPVTAVTACLLGMGSKESMATAPVMVMLFDRVFVFDSFRRAFAVRGRLYAGLMATWILLAAILWSAPRAYSTGFSTDVSVWTYLLNQTQMITRYLWLTVWPVPLVVYYGLPLPIGLSDILPHALFVTALVAATAVAFRYRPWLAFVGAWVFVTLAPTSSIVPIATEVGAERRMYLPLVGLILLAVLLVTHAGRTAGLRRPAYRVALLAVIVLLLGARTIARNREYADPLTLAQVTLDRWPSGVAHHMLGVQLLVVGRPGEAVAHLREAARDDPRAHYTLGMELLKEGQTGEAIAELQTFIRLRPYLLEVPDAHAALARAYGTQGNWDAAVEQARQAVEKSFGRPDAQVVLADSLLNLGSMDEALQAYATYLRLRPDDGGAVTNMGIAQVSLGRVEAAIASFRRAAALDPRSGAARRNLAMALLDADRLDQAVVAAREAIALTPGDEVPYDLLGQALARQGRVADAGEAFSRGLALAPGNDELRQHLAQLGGSRRP